jgi:hypothetical protein
MEMKFCAAILLTLASFNAFAGLTKWVDSQGVVHYTDGPPPPNVKSQSLNTPSTSAGIPSASAPAAPKTIYERDAELNKEKKAKEEAEQKAAKKQEEEAQKQRACSQARDQLATLQNSPRIATYNDKGERSVMDDDARQKRIDEAQASISKYCNGSSSEQQQTSPASGY